MDKRSLINSVVETLKANNVRKHITSQKTVFHISDDSGEVTDFTIRKPATGLLFTKKDVTDIVDACLAVVTDAIQRGEDISIYGFGSLGVQERKARKIRHPETQEEITVDSHYIPKFNFGNELRRAARLYELSLQDKEEAVKYAD